MSFNSLFQDNDYNIKAGTLKAKRLQDSVNSYGTANQVLKSDGTNILWETGSAVAGNKFILMNSISPVNTAEYIGIANHSAVAFPNEIITGDIGTLTNIVVNTSVAPGVGNNYAFTLVLNGTPTSHTVNISDANRYGILTFSQVFSQAENFTIQLVITGAAAPPICKIAITYQ